CLLSFSFLFLLFFSFLFFVFFFFSSSFFLCFFFFWLLSFFLLFPFCHQLLTPHQAAAILPQLFLILLFSISQFLRSLSGRSHLIYRLMRKLQLLPYQS